MLSYLFLKSKIVKKFNIYNITENKISYNFISDKNKILHITNDNGKTHVESCY